MTYKRSKKQKSENKGKKEQNFQQEKPQQEKPQQEKPQQEKPQREKPQREEPQQEKPQQEKPQQNIHSQEETPQEEASPKKNKKVASNLTKFLKILPLITIAAKGIGSVISGIASLAEKAIGISKAANAIGITGEQLQGLEYAAKKTGISVEAIPDIFNKIQNTAQKALGGDSEAIKSFGQMGISVDELKGKKPYEIFELISQSINMIDDPIERSRAGVSVFGDEFNKIQGFIGGYSSSVNEAKESGSIIDEEQLKAAQEFNEAFIQLQTKLSALAINSGFIEVMKWMLEGLDALLTNTKRMEKIGIVDRETAVNQALDKAEQSGKYSKEQIKGMREASISYGKKKEIGGFFGADKKYSTAYSDIDKVMNEAGFHGFARKKNEKGEMKFDSTDVMTKAISKEDVKRAKEQRKASFETKEQRKANRATFAGNSGANAKEVEKNTPPQAETPVKNNELEISKEKLEKPKSLPKKGQPPLLARATAENLKDIRPIGSPAVDRVLEIEKVRELVQEAKMKKSVRQDEVDLPGKNKAAVDPELDANILEALEAGRNGKTIRFSREEQEYLISGAFNALPKPDKGTGTPLIHRPGSFAEPDLPARMQNFILPGELPGENMSGGNVSLRLLENSVRNIEAILKIGLPDQTM
ncbi:MAG: hypothetical protein BWY31_03814 [Lentisphaerae bacterium ADurb.Bin242]|nr:MAG: hypothetical protein BWY31_03814 [Lentisphaerae bacterium ADurb.Bin242]